MSLLVAYRFFRLLGIVTNVGFFVFDKLLTPFIKLVHLTLVALREPRLIASAIFPSLGLAVRTDFLESLEIQIGGPMTIRSLAAAIFILVRRLITLR